MSKSKTWRFIPLMSAEGKLQMAIDSWLLNQHQYHEHQPTLRFYIWNPTAISLGVSQKHHFPSHWQNLSHNGQFIDLVKRPSGGRGVLHQGDLTYSIVTSHCEGNLDQVYRYLCQFLILGWHKLGVNLHFGQAKRQYLKSANCFSLATNADLVDDKGDKFIGSAQLRRGKYVLQHGSMILNPDRHLYQQVFHSPPSVANIDRNLSLATIIDTLKDSAQECFDCNLAIQPLSPEELQQIELNSD
jgi:lipoate-protein ligase A